MTRLLTSTLQHDRLAVRLLAALALGYLLMYAAWAVGYYLLPAGALHGWLSGGVPMQPAAAPALWVRLFAYNLALPTTILLALSRLQVGSFSLGYNVPFANVVLYGLWLGSNSFAVPMPTRLAPTLAVFWQRSGPFEMAAFLLMAAALARSARLRQLGFWGGRTVQVGPGDYQPLQRAEYLTLALAVLVLAGANWAEARMWFSAQPD